MASGWAARTDERIGFDAAAGDLDLDLDLEHLLHLELDLEHYPTRMDPIPSPEHCSSLAEIRAGIDRLDREIVALLAARGRYVAAAARFKHSAVEVQAPARVEQVIAQVRALAAGHGLDAAVVERVYRALIDGLTELELQQWQQR